MGLFSPTQHKEIVSEGLVTDIYQVTATIDGKSTIVKGPQKPIGLNFQDCCLKTQIEDGVRLMDVNPTGYISQSIDEKSTSLSAAASALENELNNIDSNIEPTN